MPLGTDYWVTKSFDNKWKLVMFSFRKYTKVYRKQSLIKRMKYLPLQLEGGVMCPYKSIWINCKGSLRCDAAYLEKHSWHASQLYKIGLHSLYWHVCGLPFLFIALAPKSTTSSCTFLWIQSLLQWLFLSFLQLFYQLGF